MFQVIHCGLLGALLTVTTASAAPDQIQACVAASEVGQQHQKAGALFAAKRAFEECGGEACPAVVRAECTRWLEEVLVAMPSIVVVVRVAGSDHPPTRVLIDGQPALAPVAGRPWDLDPGEHFVTVELGNRSAVQRLVANTGEKNRRVVFELPALTVPVTSPVVEAAAPRPFPVMPVVATSVAVAGAALFTGLGLSGRARLEALLAHECASTKTCSPAAVADVQRRFVAADVSLVVGLVGALAAAWQWWQWLAEPAPLVWLAPGSAGLGVAGRF